MRTEIEALRGETARLLDERPALENLAASEPLVGLGDYAAWSDRCEAARSNWQGMLDDPGTWRPHLDRLGEEAAAIETAVDRLAKLRGHDLFDVSMERIEETAQAARDRGILSFHDDAYREAVAEAERLAGKHELDEGVRRRLQAVLEEQAARAAEWMVVVVLLRDMGRLAQRDCQLEIDAERREVPRTKVSGWQDLQEESRRVVEDARAALDDGKLQAHWESRPDIRASIEEGLPEAELAHGHSVPINDFLNKCGRDIVLDDRLRWTEVVEPKRGMSRGSERTGREEVVQFEGGGSSGGRQEDPNSKTAASWRSIRVRTADPSGEGACRSAC